MEENLIAPKPRTEEPIKKSKKFELALSNSTIFQLEFNLMSNNISILAKKKLSINAPIYSLSLDIKKFQEHHNFFLQFPDIDELFDLINDMEKDEFFLKKENENLILILKIEQRKKIIEVPFNLERKKANLDNKELSQNMEQMMFVIKENKKEFDLFKENCLKEIEKLNFKISKLELENKELKEKMNLSKKEIDGDNNNLFSGSKIISLHDSKNFLLKCLNLKTSNVETELIYSATKDGDTIESFNKKCNGVGNTITIIKTNIGKIIGGFFRLPFSVKDDYYDPDCFLFCLNHKEKYEVDPNGEYKNHCFYGTGSNSAIIDFGEGSSIHIVNNCLSNQNYYCGRKGTFKFPQNRITNGDIHFKVIEFEVFKIKEIY